MFLCLFGRHQRKLENLPGSLAVSTQSTAKWGESYVSWVSTLFEALIMLRCTLESLDVLDSIFFFLEADLKKSERKCSAMQKSINKGVEVERERETVYLITGDSHG